MSNRRGGNRGRNQNHRKQNPNTTPKEVEPEAPKPEIKTNDENTLASLKARILTKRKGTTQPAETPTPQTEASQTPNPETIGKSPLKTDVLQMKLAQKKEGLLQPKPEEPQNPDQSKAIAGLNPPKNQVIRGLNPGKQTSTLANKPPPPNTPSGVEKTEGEIKPITEEKKTEEKPANKGFLSKELLDLKRNALPVKTQGIANPTETKPSAEPEKIATRSEANLIKNQEPKVEVSNQTGTTGSIPKEAEKSPIQIEQKPEVVADQNKAKEIPPVSETKSSAIQEESQTVQEKQPISSFEAQQKPEAQTSNDKIEEEPKPAESEKKPEVVPQEKEENKTDEIEDEAAEEEEGEEENEEEAVEEEEEEDAGERIVEEPEAEAEEEKAEEVEEEISEPSSQKKLKMNEGITEEVVQSSPPRKSPELENVDKNISKLKIKMLQKEAEKIKYSMGTLESLVNNVEKGLPERIKNIVAYAQSRKKKHSFNQRFKKVMKFFENYKPQEA